MGIQRRRHAYPRTDPARRPTAWWYYGRALYVSRRDYFKIYWALMFALGFPMVFLGLYFDWQFMKVAALGAGTVSLFYLGYSLLGMYRMYGHPGHRYVRRLIGGAGVGDGAVVADLHIGTYRHSFLIADEVPGAVVHSIDCWGVPDDPKEVAIRDVRDLETPPTGHPQVHPGRADDYTLPLGDATCDAVVFGFGTHEIPNDGPRAKLLDEAKRVLKPGGKVLLFEHGNDFHNVIIFGPVIAHVVPREEWMAELAARFAGVCYDRTSQAVDLFWGAKADPPGVGARPLVPRATRRGAGIWLVIGLFTLISLGVVMYLPERHLVAIYLGVAFLGLAWPWLMIGVALAGDRLTRAGGGVHPRRLEAAV